MGFMIDENRNFIYEVAAKTPAPPPPPPADTEKVAKTEPERKPLIELMNPWGTHGGSGGG